MASRANTLDVSHSLHLIPSHASSAQIGGLDGKKLTTKPRTPHPKNLLAKSAAAARKSGGGAGAAGWPQPQPLAAAAASADKGAAALGAAAPEASDANGAAAREGIPAGSGECTAVAPCHTVYTTCRQTCALAIVHGRHSSSHLVTATFLKMLGWHAQAAVGRRGPAPQVPPPTAAAMRTPSSSGRRPRTTTSTCSTASPTPGPWVRMSSNSTSPNQNRKMNVCLI